MSRTFVIDLLMLLLFVDRSWALLKSLENESLEDGSVIKVSLANLPDNETFVQQISIPPTSNIMFNIANASSHVSFITFQIHTYQYNVTLSYDKAHLNNVSSQSVFGSNIGLVVKTKPKVMTQIFLKSDNVRKVDAIVVAVLYNNTAPIPGGCNMEFNTEVAPYEKLVVRDAVVVVDVQPASVPLVTESKPVCEKNPVQHEMYHMYLPEQDFSTDTYFSAIKNMLTPENIVKNGKKIPTPFVSSPMRRVFSAYHGTGAVYVAVATYGNYSSAYVPAFSYSCSPLLYPESCQILNGTLSKMLCAATFFLGMFSVFLGRRYARIEMTLPVLFTGVVIGYAVAVGTTSFSMQSNIGIAITVGFLAVLLSTLLTTFIFVCNTWISGLILGFLVSSIAYFVIADHWVTLAIDWIFWLLFVTIQLTVLLIMIQTHCVAQLLTRAIFGSFMVILPIDYYIGSSLKYIIINVIRRAIVPDFDIAIIHPPYQTKDIILTVLWISLTLYRIIKPFNAPVANVLRLNNIQRLIVVTERTPLIPTRQSSRRAPTVYL